MAEKEDQEKVKSVVDLEDKEDDQQTPLDDSSSDRNWTPGRINRRRGDVGARGPFSDPGKFPYQLRETISKRLVRRKI